MKKSAMLMLCLVLAFALTACAGTDTTPQGSVSEEHTSELQSHGESRMPSSA